MHTRDPKHATLHMLPLRHTEIGSQGSMGLPACACLTASQPPAAVTQTVNNSAPPVPVLPPMLPQTRLAAAASPRPWAHRMASAKAFYPHRRAARSVACRRPAALLQVVDSPCPPRSCAPAADEADRGTLADHRRRGLGAMRRRRSRVGDAAGSHGGHRRHALAPQQRQHNRVARQQRAPAEHSVHRIR